MKNGISKLLMLCRGGYTKHMGEDNTTEHMHKNHINLQYMIEDMCSKAM
jgi:hypothetical protein